MTEPLRSVLESTGALSLALLAATVLTWRRPLVTSDTTGRQQARRFFLFALALQCIHFLEEFVTGFDVELPQLLGLAPWPADFFVVFNVFWIALWILASVGLEQGRQVALLPVWFFALGMAINGVAHPLLALRAGGYFPGLASSPVVGVVGVVLLIRLVGITGKERGSRSHEES